MKIERLEILDKISDIEDKHCSICTIDTSKDNKYCYTECSYGLEIRELGKQLESQDKEKIKETLNKGKDMTIKDVKMLLNKGVPREKVARNIGIRSNANTKKWFDSVVGKVEEYKPKRQKPFKRRKGRYDIAKGIIEANQDKKRKQIVDLIISGTGSSQGIAYSYIRRYENEKTGGN